jgi:hypothetical protein
VAANRDPQHACFQKRRYPDQKSAEAGLRAALQNPHVVILPGRYLLVYPCVECGGYHLGTRQTQ